MNESPQKVILLELLQQDYASSAYQ